MDACLCFVWTCALLLLISNIAQAQTLQNGQTWTNGTSNILPLCDYTSVTSGTLECPNGIISITSAHYGRQSNTPCPYSSRTCSGMDVTSRVVPVCDGRKTCTLTCTNNNWTALSLTRKTVCSKVYYKELRISYTCTAVNPTVTCNGLPTGAQPNYTTGWPNSCSGMAVGSMCVAPCTAGYNSTSIRAAGISSICSTDGKWSATDGECLPMTNTSMASPNPIATCAGLPTSSAPAYSTGWPSSCNNMQVENICTAACVSGYTGGYLSICIDGSWDVVDGTCTKVINAVTTCSGLPTFMPPANSTAWPAGCSGLSVGGVCTASCASGFTGGYNSTCTSSGAWSAVTGSCIEVTCPGVPVWPVTSPAPKAFTAWPQACAGAAVGATCTVPCGPGTTGNPFVSHCGADGAWGPVSWQCVDVTCPGNPTPDLPAHSQGFSGCDGAAIGAVCTARCAQGTVGAGYTATCQMNGTWSPLVGFCEVTCPGNPTPDLPAHSQGFSGCDGAAIGAVCTARCAQGTVGAGYTATCQMNGTWSPLVGSCEVRCNALPTATAPAHSNGWPEVCQGRAPEESCVAVCADGYGGANYISTCQADGTWSPAEGYCAPLSCSGQPTDNTPLNSVGWTDSSARYDQINTNFSALALGAADGCSGAEGSVCTSPCQQGYSGGYTSTCGAGGKWSQVQGSCVPAYCPGLPAAQVAGGTSWPSNCTDAAIGANCTQLCRAGYSGSLSSKCLPDMTWSTTVAGSCVEDTCSEAPQALFEGTQAWPSTCRGTKINGTCTAACAERYSGAGWTRRCIAKDTWDEPTGACVRDTCSGPPPYTDLANTLGWSEDCVNLTTGANCTARCDSQFGTPYVVECVDKDTWGPLSGSCPEACTSPPTEDAPENSRGWGPNCLANGAQVGGRCVAGCATNFRGRLFSFCVGKSQWSEVNGTCEPVCKMVHRGCETCRSVRIQGTRNASELVCNRCFAGWRLRRDGESKTCDCAPGFMLTGPSDDPDSTCVPCEEGKYCPGGNEDDNPESLAYNCSRGLETIIPGAKSEMQCYTKPGFGRTMRLIGNDVRVAVFVCPVGSYNSGGNTAGCTKCGQGLTTMQTGSVNVSMCMAPAGSYVDRGVTSKFCPRGTYTTDFNNLPNCNTCPDGITTQSENSTGVSDCRLAKIGYYLVNATTADLCPVGWFQGREAEVYQCNECPYGWITKDEGSEGKANCMAPPGFELKEGADWISECEIGFFKEGWNKNPCVQCGNGLTTAKNGSVSKDDCLIPSGWGIISLDPLVAVPCVNNSYGVDTTRAVVSSSRCVLCAPNLFTSDTLSGIPATRGYTQEMDCVVKPGWGISASGMVEVCPAGTYNTGYNRKRCAECGTGYTSISAGAEDEDACVVQPGWALDLKHRIPKPCDVGTFSTGGDLDNPAAECQPCPVGFTTQKDEADTVEDCEVCTAGHGGLNCTICPYNTYSTGVQQQGIDCVPCAPGTVSARGSIQNTQCVPEQVDSDRDYFPLSDGSKWTDIAAVTLLDCQYQCNSNAACIIFRSATDLSAPKCQLLIEDPAGTQAVALKGDASSYGFAVYTVPADLRVGVLVADQGTNLTPLECMRLCSASSRCELVSLDVAALPSSAGPCRLYASEFDADWIGMYHIQGNKLHADMLLGE